MATSQSALIKDECGVQVLFFSTILANLVGRTLPKWKAFAITSPTFLMYLGFVKLAAAPICFVYLKSPDSWHSDVGATGISVHSFQCPQHPFVVPALVTLCFKLRLRGVAGTRPYRLHNFAFTLASTVQCLQSQQMLTVCHADYLCIICEAFHMNS